jgi:RNA polymerase sigma factor (sigma-70 family)
MVAPNEPGGLLSCQVHVSASGMFDTAHEQHDGPGTAAPSAEESGAPQRSETPPGADRWVDQARRGTGAGFDALFGWLAGPVKGFAAARGAVDPDGIVNEVFLRAFRSIDGFSGGAAEFRAWTFTTARNLLIDEARMRARRPPISDQPSPEVPTAGTEDDFLAVLGNDRVARLLAELTDSQREVIALRIVADLSLAEVADLVGRPISAVKRLQARALRTLQKKVLEEAVS